MCSSSAHLGARPKKSLRTRTCTCAHAHAHAHVHMHMQSLRGSPSAHSSLSSRCAGPLRELDNGCGVRTGESFAILKNAEIVKPFTRPVWCCWSASAHSEEERAIGLGLVWLVTHAQLQLAWRKPKQHSTAKEPFHRCALHQFACPGGQGGRVQSCGVVFPDQSLSARCYGAHSYGARCCCSGVYCTASSAPVAAVPDLRSSCHASCSFWPISHTYSPE